MSVQPAPALPTPPTPPPAPIVAGGRIVLSGDPTSPQAIYQAAKARGRELASQLEALQDRRGELSQRLQEVASPVDRKGLEQQLGDIDQRIASVNAQIAQADQQIAQAAGIPGAVVDPPMRSSRDDGPPPELIATLVITIFVFFPLAIAYARRLWKRPVAAPAPIPPELTERMARLEQAVEAVAVEVERIGEGQRFVTKLFAERGAQPLELPK